MNQQEKDTIGPRRERLSKSKLNQKKRPKLKKIQQNNLKTPNDKCDDYKFEDQKKVEC